MTYHYREQKDSPEKTEDLSSSQKNGKDSDLQEDEDADFDDWQGVSREGIKTSSEGEDNDDSDNDDKDDDGPDGGEMMPIPGLF